MNRAVTWDVITRGDTSGVSAGGGQRPVTYFDSTVGGWLCGCGCGCGEEIFAGEFVHGHEQAALHLRVAQIGTVPEFVRWFDAVRVGSQGNAKGSDTRTIAHSPGGDTLVIIRNSKGVQVGDHNVQRNHFRIVVAPVSVRVGGVLETSERLKAVGQLRVNPADRSAARQLAEDIDSAAQDYLVADVTASL